MSFDSMLDVEIFFFVVQPVDFKISEILTTVSIAFPRADKPTSLC